MFKTVGKAWRGAKLVGRTVSKGIETVGAGLEELNQSLEVINNELQLRLDIQSSIKQLDRVKRLLNEKLSATGSQFQVSRTYLTQGSLFVELMTENLEIMKRNAATLGLNKRSDFNELTEQMVDGIEHWLASNSSRKIETLLQKKSFKRSISEILDESIRDFSSDRRVDRLGLTDRRRIKEIIVEMKLIKSTIN